MGISPPDVKAMSLAEYVAVCEVWSSSHGDTAPPPPSDEDYYRLVGGGR